MTPLVWRKNAISPRLLCYATVILAFHHCTGSQPSVSRGRVLAFYRIAPCLTIMPLHAPRKSSTLGVVCVCWIRSQNGLLLFLHAFLERARVLLSRCSSFTSPYFRIHDRCKSHPILSSLLSLKAAAATPTPSGGFNFAPGSGGMPGSPFASPAAAPTFGVPSTPQGTGSTLTARSRARLAARRRGKKWERAK